MNYKNIILRMGFTNTGINKSFTCKLSKNPNKYSNIIFFILHYYDDYTETIREGLYRLKYNITKIPCCPVCGRQLKFVGKNNKIYLSHCSNRCKKLDKNVQDKFIETCQEKYGEHNLTNRIQAKQTCLEKYGVENPFQIDEIKNKIRLQNKEYFDNGLTQEKMRKTCIEKYGTEYFLQTQEAKNKRINSSINKYGTQYPIQSDIVKSKYDWKNIVDKIQLTKEKNNTWNTSTIEQQLCEYFDVNNVNYKYQYKSDVYPYCCDFYFPDKDLYVEIQGNWTHGGKPFENTEEDNIKLNKWILSDKEYYKNAIYTWTISDVNKRNTAKQNKLNYLEIFSINLNECINKIINVLNDK